MQQVSLTTGGSFAEISRLSIEISHHAKQWKTRIHYASVTHSLTIEA